MFKRVIEKNGNQVRIIFEGNDLVVFDGDTVAAAVLSVDTPYTRTTAVSEKCRSPYCLMGVCFGCLMEIDGIENRQACITRVQERMVVRRQHGKRGVDDKDL